jgi:hypothetical protein
METTKKSIKWVVSQRTGGAPDSEQYLSGGTPGSLCREARNQALLGCSNGLFGVHRTVWLTIRSNGQLL